MKDILPRIQIYIYIYIYSIYIFKLNIVFYFFLQFLSVILRLLFSVPN